MKSTTEDRVLSPEKTKDSFNEKGVAAAVKREEYARLQTVGVLVWKWKILTSKIVMFWLLEGNIESKLKAK